MTASEIVSAFIDRINAHDVDGVCSQAVVGDKGIAVWQVFADNEPIRQIMSRVAKNAAAT